MPATKAADLERHLAQLMEEAEPLRLVTEAVTNFNLRRAEAAGAAGAVEVAEEHRQKCVCLCSVPSRRRHGHGGSGGSGGLGPSRSLPENLNCTSVVAVFSLNLDV